MAEVQLNLFEEFDADWYQKQRIKELETQVDKLRKALFSRQDMLAKELILLWNEIERIKEVMP